MLEWVIELQEHVRNACAIVVAIELTGNIAQPIKHSKLGVLGLLLVIVDLLLLHDVVQALVKALFEVIGVVEGKWRIQVLLLLEFDLVFVSVISVL